ncbi:MAG: hypothetical protein JWQ94_2003 [Tardiphaga sp.]|nr:hypothetical protein [Tardiphaga sp.]
MPGGDELIVRQDRRYRTSLLALLCAAPVLAGCAGVGGEMFQTDLLSKDANWFSKPGRVFIKNVSIETPPLTPDKPVTPADLIGADGSCPGMAPASNALADGAAAAPTSNGVVALGHTECDVARGAGAPDNVALSNNGRGDRVAVLTYSRGDRAGIYTFTAGRLTMVERGPEAAPQPKVAKPRAKKRAAT